MNTRGVKAGFVGRFLGSWQLALGELVIVFLGVLIALWADQAMQAREDSVKAISYLEGLQADLRADLETLRFSRDQARARLDLARQLDQWISDEEADPDADLVIIYAHYSGVTFSPTISRFTIEELKSTGDLRLLRNTGLKREIANYYKQIDLQVGEWIVSMGNEGTGVTYFRELAFVLDPESRIRAGTIDPALLQRFLSASDPSVPESLPDLLADVSPIAGAPGEGELTLERMRERPNFQAYLRDGMYWAHLTSQLLDGLILTAEALEQSLSHELQTLGQ